MGKVLAAKLQKPEKVKAKNLEKYDLIGFGSGIYGWQHHKSLLKLVDRLPQTNQKAFIFSTSGKGGKNPNHWVLRKKLYKKGFKIIGEFNCQGLDKFGPLRFIGGINKGRPNEKDLTKAKKFALKLKLIK